VPVKGLPEQDHTRSAKSTLPDPKQDHRLLPDIATRAAMSLACPKSDVGKAEPRSPARSSTPNRSKEDVTT
jgi:hypothetical protein